MKNSRGLSCSAAFSRVISEAAVDVLGQSEAANLTGNAERGLEIDALIEALRKFYGPGGSKGVAQRLGQAAFKYFLDFFGKELNLTSMDYRLLPGRKRLKTGLEAVSHKLGEECGAKIELEMDESAYYWHISAPGGDDPIRNGFSYFLAGMAQELMSWSGGGRFFSVREIPGAAACVLKMDQKPLD